MKLPKSIVVVLISVISVVLVLISVFYFFFGLDKYIYANYKVYTSYQGEDRNLRFKILNGDYSQGSISGILAYADSNRKMLYLWSGNRLWVIPTYYATVFSHFYACTDENKLAFREKLPFTIAERELNNSFEDWSKLLEKGAYVSVEFSEDDSVKKNTAREIRSKDLWMFLPINLEDQCK